MGAKATTMAISMINIKAVTPSSEAHNNRAKDYDHVEPEQGQNEHWESKSIAMMQSEVAHYCKHTSGRKLQKNATPIREGVVLLNPNHTMDDLKKLADDIEAKFKVKCFQIHIHRDEGHFKNKTKKEGWTPNLHAHMVFRWQDMETGKVMRHNKAAMSQLQTLVAASLEMDRGELKTNSNRKRLEPIEYKAKQEEIRMSLLQEQNEILEQKKNEVRARIEKLKASGEGIGTQEEVRRQKEAIRDIFLASEDISEEDERKLLSFDEIALSEAIKEFEGEVNTTAQRIEALAGDKR